MRDSLNETGKSLPECGGVLASHWSTMNIDLLIGRGLAFCVHPRAAWRVLSTPGRAFVVAAYAGAGYVAVLGVLLLS
jgi:hypothetical protein